MPLTIRSDPYRAGEFRQDFQQGGDLETTPKQVVFALNNETPDSNQIVTAIANFAVQYGANPLVRSVAEKIMPANLQPNDMLAQYNAVATFVLRHLVYVRDPNAIEYIVSPVQHLNHICANGVSYGDCDDHVVLFNSLLNSLGFTTFVVGVQADPTTTLFTHVISGVKLAGKFYYFDACNKTNPYEVPAGQLLVLQS